MVFSDTDLSPHTVLRLCMNKNTYRVVKIHKERHLSECTHTVQDHSNPNSGNDIYESV